MVLTWPLHLVSGDDGTVGYVMPRLDISNAVEIHTISNPSNRANPLPAAPQWTPHVAWHHLVNIAANLCLAVETVHRVDAVIGDFQERNILVNDTTRVSLVDCDSMQFTDRNGQQYLCGVGRAEFTAPELAGVDLSRTARDKPSDLFALAVHVHLLLMAGNHPFLRGEWTGPGEQPDALSLARTGQWAGGPQSNLRTHALAPPVDFLPPAIQQLFTRAFTDGVRDPSVRPSAAAWREQLQRIQVGTCARGHQIPVEADPCPWCAIDDARAVRKSAHPQPAVPQRAMPVVPKQPAVAPYGRPLPAAPVPSRTRRNVLIGVGAAVALVASIVTVTIALSDSGDDRSTATGSSAATTRNAAGNSGATATVQSCDVPSSFGSATVSLTQEGLAVDVPIQTDCDAAVSLSGAGVQVAVFDGARDVAAGVFNLDMRPVVVSGQTTQRFVFPAGMYWRTPEMVSSTLTAEITGAEQDVTSRSTTGSGAVAADRPLPPAHGTFDSVAAAALSELSGADYPAVRDGLANRWVPQISSKQIGLVTDGITYADPDILRNHLSLRQRYEAVRLVWSGHWTTFNAPNWWVTVVGSPSGDPAVANGWCDAHNIDSWNCIAKYISDTAGPDGTTVIRR
ncbi:hypothetical protein [Mycolicibacterium diernhoferi]|uniref:hypothetical protein n=1 Tax=Mycolicibacterium diernhoferi TaxID=1801 RepID=UPI001F3A027B|nr:hypothetical protein [Mycolicibacterium diernhoferi]